MTQRDESSGADPAAVERGPGRRRPAGSRRLLALGLALAAVAIPFLAVRYAPISDLPQQAAQVRLAIDALSDPESLYRVRWAAPNSLSLGVLALAWAVSTPVAAGRLAMLALALAWVGAVHWLAWRRRRPAGAAVLGSLAVFGPSLFWGYYSFLLGFPLFVAWLLHGLGDDGRRPWRRAAGYLPGAVLLGLAHALWLAAGLAWLALDTVLARNRRPLRSHLVRWLAVAPVALGSWAWFSGLGGSGFATPALWAQPVWRRLEPDWLADSAFGGVRGPLPAVLLALLLGYLLMTLVTARGRLRSETDGALAAAGGLLLVAALVLPDKYTGTIHFAARWVSPALVLLLLSLPPPRLRRRSLVAAVAAAALAVQSVAVTAAWRRVEAEELTGLDAALAALPPSPRVIGLHLGPPSRYLDGAPFTHVYAYAQALHGGELSFSFAELPSSPVVYRRPREVAWTPDLAIAGWRVQSRDFAYFDFALIDAEADRHRGIASGDVLEPVTTEGRWRLYRVLPPPGAPPAPPS